MNIHEYNKQSKKSILLAFVPSVTIILHTQQFIGRTSQFAVTQHTYIAIGIDHPIQNGTLANSSFGTEAHAISMLLLLFQCKSKL